MKALLLAHFLFFTLPAMAKTYPLSDHYDGKVFFNHEDHELKSFWQVLKWQLTADRKEWPAQVSNHPYPLPILTTQKGIITFINHASFLIQLPGQTLLTDPIFSERASPVTFAGPKRVRRPGIELENLPPIDVVIISHNHYDHLDLESLKQLDAKFKPLFLVPLGDEKLLKAAGIQNVKELDWWDEIKIKETKITFTPAKHWSARSLFDKCESLWGSYHIDHLVMKIYFAGDTGYGKHFKELYSKLGAPDLSLIPVGAYEPRWFMRPHHLNPEDAVLAHLDLGSKLSFGMHLGTFQLTDEGYDDPIVDLNRAREKFQLSKDVFRLLDHGESYQF
jgi:L-ascorbate metabolism protein UlaG (beta-lactamase superfamily)